MVICYVKINELNTHLMLYPLSSKTEPFIDIIPQSEHVNSCFVIVSDLILIIAAEINSTYTFMKSPRTP